MSSELKPVNNRLKPSTPGHTSGQNSNSKMHLLCSCISVYNSQDMGTTGKYPLRDEWIKEMWDCPMAQQNTTQQWEEWNNAICGSMDAARVSYYLKQVRKWKTNSKWVPFSSGI